MNTSYCPIHLYKANARKTLNTKTSNGWLTFNRQVGQVCCRWNQERRHEVWKIWLHGSFLEAVVISSRQIIQTLSAAWSSSGVASGYKVFIFLIARLDNITSLNAFLKFLQKQQYYEGNPKTNFRLTIKMIGNVFLMGSWFLDESQMVLTSWCSTLVWKRTTAKCKSWP